MAIREPRTYTLKKIDIADKDNKPIKSKLNSLFNNPQTYFASNTGGNEIIIGKKQKFPRYNENGVLLPYCYVGELSKQVRKGGLNTNSILTTNESRINQSTMRSFLTPNSLQKRRGSYSKNYLVINDYQLGDLFDGYRKRIQSNESLGHNRFISETPQIKGNTLQRIMLQEKVLANKEKENDIAQKLEEKIALKTKKPINALLMNSINKNAFRVKQEIIQAAVKEDNRFNMNDWLSGLRDSKNSKEKKYCFVKGRNDYLPIYGLELHHQGKEANELISDPDYNYNGTWKTEYNTIKTHEYRSNSTECSKFLKTTSAFRNLSVKGNNLLKVEYENAKTIKGNKRLLKKNEEENTKNDSNIIENWKSV